LGHVDGRTGAAVQAWVAARTEEFRAGVAVVVIGPHAGYAAAVVRATLPEAAIAVDHFHLVMAANRAVTARPDRADPFGVDREGGAPRALCDRRPRRAPPRDRPATLGRVLPRFGRKHTNAQTDHTTVLVAVDDPALPGGHHGCAYLPPRR
jgi:transposase